MPTTFNVTGIASVLFPKAMNNSGGSARYCLIALLLILNGLCAAHADQTHKNLPELFDTLNLATEASTAAEIESKIWQLWLEAPNENARLLMSQVTHAMSSSQMTLALRLADQLIDSSPRYAEAWNKRATIYYLIGDNDASVADIRETLSLEPRHFGAISGLGLIFLRQNNPEAALDAFEQVLAISPASSNAIQSIERVRQELGKEI